MKILIIGCGNMGMTYAKSFVNTHLVKAENLYILEKSEEKLHSLSLELGCVYNSIPGPYIKECDLIIFAVKPQDLEALLPKIKEHIDQQQLILSIMAGVTIKQLQDRLGTLKVVRCMPNLPAQIGFGMTVFTSSEDVTRIELVTVQNLLNTTGKVIYVEDESMINSATAISGSGPAYVFFFMKSLIEASESMGFDQSQSEILTYQTFRGAIELFNKFNYSCEEWIEKVASKGGTTEAAFIVLKKEDVAKKFILATDAAKLRAKELSELA